MIILAQFNLLILWSVKYTAKFILFISINILNENKKIN